MAKINKTKEETPRKLYDAIDLSRLQREVGAFEQQERGGRLQSPFEIYCENAGLMRFDQYGNTVVQNATGYSAAVEMWEEIQKKKNRQNYAEKKELQQLDQIAPPPVPAPSTKTPSRVCVKCETQLTGRLEWYCSGECLGKAKADGTYGREAELQDAINAI